MEKETYIDLGNSGLRCPIDKINLPLTREEAEQLLTLVRARRDDLEATLILAAEGASIVELDTDPMLADFDRLTSIADKLNALIKDVK